MAFNGPKSGRLDRADRSVQGRVSLPAPVGASAGRVGAEEMALLRAFRRHVEDVEVTPDDVFAEFIELGRCPVRTLTCFQVEEVVTAHPEVLELGRQGWSWRSRTTTPALRTRGGVAVPDSPSVWMPFMAFNDRGRPEAVERGHDLTWAQIAAHAWAQLKSDNIKGLDIVLWDEGLRRRSLITVVSLMVDDEPAWIAATRARTDRARLMRALRDRGWSFWPWPHAMSTWIGPGHPPKWYLGPRKPRPGLDWSDDRTLARKPLAWTDVIATYRAFDERVVLAGALALLRDDFGMPSARVSLEPHPCTDEETLARRRARLGAKKQFVGLYRAQRPGSGGGGGHKPAPLDYCTVCGQGISDPVSLARGMGDICAADVGAWSRANTAVMQDRQFAWTSRHDRAAPHLWSWATPADKWQAELTHLLGELTPEIL